MGVGCQTRLLFLKATVKIVQVFSQLLIGLSAGGRGLVAGNGFQARTQTCGAPTFRVMELEVNWPIFTTCGLPVRN